MKINPNDAENYFNIGVTYFEKRDYHTSLQYYKEALKLRPDYPSAYINMGSMAFEDMGEIEKGLEYLKKAQELNIEDDFILKALYESFIDVYTLLEDFDQVAFYRLKVANLE